MDNQEVTLIPGGIEIRMQHEPLLEQPRKSTPPVAILTDNVRMALIDLHHRIASFSHCSYKGVFKDGQEFFLATEHRHLMGAKISSYELFGHPDYQLVVAARARMF